jgi:hypothetical protein
MGIHYRKVNIHWNYFLAIENDFEKMTRYVELTESNNQTFSIEFARLIMSATQEVDVILKKICELVSENSPERITEYRPIIVEKLTEFSKEIIQIPRFGMSSQPWESWIESENSPEWWKANNKIKHNRTDNFEKANLKNAFNSIGGLLIATMYFYKAEFEKIEGAEISWTDLTHKLKPNSTLFRLKDDYYVEPGEWPAIEW